jgi:hypothetical protein
MSSDFKNIKSFEVTNLTGNSNDSTWWKKQSVADRLVALLELRKIVYGDAVTGRLQRVLEITELR